jgi:hypothetical protein
MGWKFWKKDDALAPKKSKLPGPRELPDAVGRVLVVEREMDPDFAWSLRALLRPREGAKYIREVRVFDPASTSAAGIAVKNYDSLESHPEQVLFAGWFNTDTGEAELTPKSTEKAA